MTPFVRILTALIAAATGLAAPIPAATAAGGHKVLVFVEENRTEAQALSRMPYVASLAKKYGRASNYRAVAHPSLPNYLAIAGGSTFGVDDDAPPSGHHIAGRSVFDQTLAVGKRARTYAESLPKKCARANSGLYLARHNPWTYFSDPGPAANCARYDVPAGTPGSGTLREDILAGNLPATGFMIPNSCDDAHNSRCSLAGADSYFKSWMELIKKGPDWRHGHLTVILTFDEDDRSGNNKVAFVVADPRLHGKTVGLAANHYSLTRWLETNVGAPLLHKAATAPGLKYAFGL